MRVYDAAATSGPAACEVRTFCTHPAVASLRSFSLPGRRARHTGIPPANRAEPGPRPPRQAPKGDAPGPRPSSRLNYDGPARMGADARPAWPGTRPTRHLRSSRPAAPSPPGPPRPRRTPAPSRRARGLPTAKGALSAGDSGREGGGRQLRVASSADALTGSQIARALSDDAADGGFAVPSRDRAFWDH